MKSKSLTSFLLTALNLCNYLLSFDHKNFSVYLHMFIFNLCFSGTGYPFL